jgi:disulfide bond formation protein DsbB
LEGSRAYWKSTFFSPLPNTFNWWCYQQQIIFKPVHISAIFIFCYTDHEISIAQTKFQKLPLKLEGSRAYWKSSFFSPLPNIFIWWCIQPQLILKPLHISKIFIFCYTDHEISIAQTNFQKLPLKLEGSRAYWKSSFFSPLPNIFIWWCIPPQLILKPLHISKIFIFCYTDHEISIAQTKFQKLPLKLEGFRAYCNSPFLAFILSLYKFHCFLYVSLTLGLN